MPSARPVLYLCVMKKIMFLCHGNICRSPMAEFVMKDLVEKAGLEKEFLIDSAAVSSEESGNGMYPATKSVLLRKGVPVGGHRAHRITQAEFDEYDLIIVMDRHNVSLLSGIVGREKVYGSGKVHMLMEYASSAPASGQFACPDVADPWYTRDFERSYQDILSGCKGLLDHIRQQ